jgi:transposase
LGSKKLLIVWDGLAAHKSRMVRHFLDSLDGKVVMDFLPPYAPELNPVEYIWSYWKKNEMANFCPKQFHELSSFARRRLRSVQQKRTLISSFWQHTQLKLDL